jgi:16S rRNA (cytosine1402-N4)-methyltransferase
MLRECLAALELRPGQVIADGTVGAGGHAAEIMKKLGPTGKVIGFDRDPLMLGFAKQKLDAVKFADGTSARSGLNFHLVHAAYSEMPVELEKLAIDKVDGILLDLGYSSDQLTDHARGFSFNSQGPLDLRFDVTQGQSAAEYLAEVDEDTLTEVLKEYGEEPQAARIAAGILYVRPRQPVTTASELADVVLKSLGVEKSVGQTHPATRTFQALRIAINRELDILQDLLKEVAVKCLRPGGRLAIISFHSLEDRFVKQAFKAKDLWMDVTSKPILPSAAEVRFNPRSRSAKLRIAKYRG